MEKEELSLEKFKALAQDVLDSEFGQHNDLWLLEETVEEDTVDYSSCLQATLDCVYAEPDKKLTPEVARLAEYVMPLGEFYGNDNAVNDFGTLFYDGRLRQDFEKALHYYKIAEKMGNSYSAENLGYIYYYGRCGEKNYEKAFLQFVKGAVTFGRAISYYKLGDMYKNGFYIERDWRAAFRCYLKAEKMIDDGEYANRFDNCAADIYFRLGDAYLKGLGTETDVSKALEYLQKAELAFYVRLDNGEYMLKKVLRNTLKLQEEAREILCSRIPDFKWAAENVGSKTI